MNKFKQICMKAHTEKKEALHNLYTDRHRYLSSVSSSEQPVEDEKLFHYRNVVFQFCGTGFRTMQNIR